MFGHHTIGIDYDAIPGATYCNPQVASVGMTEAQAKEKGIVESYGSMQDLFGGMRSVSDMLMHQSF
jgi:dihydrolipoamide dehydrogenase